MRSGRAAPEAADSERIAKPASIRTSLQLSNDPVAHGAQQALPPRRIEDELCAIERRAQNSRVCNLATDAATYARVLDMRHRILTQRIGIGSDRERGTPRQANA